MNKNIIIAGVIAAGLYLFSQTKKTAQRIWSTATPTIRQRTAQKIAQKIAQKVALKRIGQPTTQAARIAAARKAAARKVNISKMPVRLLRLLIAHAAAHKKTGKEVAVLKAEVARRERVAWLVAQKKVAQKRIGVPINRTAYLAAARKAAARKAAAQKIGKKIGKTVSQNIAQKIKTRRAVMAWYAKRQRPQIQRPRPTNKQATSGNAPFRFPNS